MGSRGYGVLGFSAFRGLNSRSLGGLGRLEVWGFRGPGVLGVHGVWGLRDVRGVRVWALQRFGGFVVQSFGV